VQVNYVVTLVSLSEVGGTSLHHQNVTSSDENSSWGKKKLNCAIPKRSRKSKADFPFIPIDKPHRHTEPYVCVLQAQLRISSLASASPSISASAPPPPELVFWPG
jgi:hypothetical protein